nr:Yip1 domain [Hymenolepis microstoma]
MPVGGYAPVPTDPQFDDVDLVENDEDSVQDNDSPSVSASKFSIDYYRTYFDVDTYQVVQRVFSGLIPFSKRFSLAASLKPTPDLYGPFWITVTIIFSVAFSGSIHEYIQSKDAAALSTFNFGRVTISTTLLFLYWCLLPAILTSIVYFKRRNLVPDIEVVQDEPKLKLGSLFTELLAIYGYSMVSFVPAAMLLCIPGSYLQYTLIGVACVISLIVLCTTTWSTFKKRRKKLAFGLLILIIVAHLIMTVSLSVVFFHQPVRQAESVQSPQQSAADAKSENDASKKSDPNAQAPGGEKVKPAGDVGGDLHPSAESQNAAVESQTGSEDGKKESNAKPKAI